MTEFEGLDGEAGGGLAAFMKELFKAEENGNDDGVDPLVEQVISKISTTELHQRRFLMSKI